MYTPATLCGLEFDPERRAGAKGLKTALAALARHLEAREADLSPRKRARKEADRAKFVLAVEVIGCNLLLAKWLANDAPSIPGPPIEVYRSLSKIDKADADRPEVYGQGLLDVLDLMCHREIGLAEQTRGHHFAGSEGQPSTISPRPALWTFLPLTAFDPSTLQLTTVQQVLVLKGPKVRTGRGRGTAPTLPTPDNRNVRTMRNAMLRINAGLRMADISLTGEESSGPRFGWDKTGRPLDPTRRTLRRHFSNASLQQSGRLFGGFWQQMGREDRLRRLRIDGERVADVDYGQLYPRLCYALKGLEQPLEDLYAVAEFKDHRAGIKKLFNAMLFAEKPLTHWPTDTLDLFPSGTKLATVTTALMQRHPAIADHFGTGVGFKLMAMESAMLVDVLRGLLARGIVALPIHDAVMVAAPHAETAKAAMLEAFDHFQGFQSLTLEHSRGLVQIEYPADFCGL